MEVDEKLGGGVHIYRVKGPLDVRHMTQIWLPTWQQGRGYQQWDPHSRECHALLVHRAWARWAHALTLARMPACIVPCPSTCVTRRAQCRTGTYMHTSTHNAVSALAHDCRLFSCVSNDFSLIFHFLTFHHFFLLLS